MNALAQRAWLVFLLLGVAAVLGAPIMLLGNPPVPPSAEQMTGQSLTEIDALIPGIRQYVGSISVQMGNFMLAMGVMLSAIAGGPFRRGERWAWLTLWIVPVLVLIQFVNSNFGLGWQVDLGLIPITVAALLVTRPR